MPEKDLAYDDTYVLGHGFGGYTLEKDGLLIWLAGWPDVLDAYHVTEYRFTSGAYNVFGISVGSTLSDAVLILEAQGYTLDSGANRCFVYQKGKQAEITLTADTVGCIYEIWVTAVVTNKQGVVF